MHIPVNRWTIGVMLALTLIFGNDIVAPLYKVFGILSAPYVPAV